MSFQQGPGNIRAFVVAWNQENRDAEVRDVQKRLKSLGDDSRRNSAAKEHIAAVQQQIDLLLQRRRQGFEIVGHKICAAASALHAWAQRSIQAEMGVGQKQQPDGVVESLRHSDSRKCGG